MNYEDLIKEDTEDTIKQVKKQKAFVVAATVASELNAAVNIARDMSIVAKNARAIALRAGEQAAGFKAITNFINEMASLTITAANTINIIAVDVSKNAVRLINIIDSRERFEKALKICQHDGISAASIEAIVQQKQQEVVDLEDLYDRAMWKLTEQLDEINQQMRAAGVIAVTSRVEASRAGEYEESLNVVAENVHQAAEGIRKHLQKSKSLLASN